METISEYAGQLVVVRCWCGIQHAVPESLRRVQLQQRDAGKRKVVYCPLGHEYYPAGKSETDKLREKLELEERKLVRERASHDQTRARLSHTESCRRAEKAAKTKLKKRIANGVCPCCNRHFVNVQRHIESQHPEFKEIAP